MAGRTEKLFKLGVVFYVLGLAAVLAGVGMLARLISPSVDAPELGALLLITGLGLMGGGWVLRKNTRGG